MKVKKLRAQFSGHLETNPASCNKKNDIGLSCEYCCILVNKFERASNYTVREIAQDDYVVQMKNSHNYEVPIRPNLRKYLNSGDPNRDPNLFLFLIYFIVM
jgi:hypothetical protein